jgi:hypothetical protein
MCCVCAVCECIDIDTVVLCGGTVYQTVALKDLDGGVLDAVGVLSVP